MRRPPRTSLTAVLLAVAALAATACGGSEVSADEVPGPPPALTVPTDEALGAGGAEPDADADADTDTADPDATATPDAGAEPVEPSGGAAAPETQTAPDDTAANDTAPPADSEAEQFESFCEQNAGAC